MLDKKDLDALEKMFDKKFLEVEDRLDKKMDAKLDAKLDIRFTKFTKEVAEVLQDFTYTIDKRFSDMEAKFDKKIEEQNKKLDTQDKKLSSRDKKLDFLIDCYKDNLEQHELYTSDLSRINSKLFDHDLRLNSLERKFTTITI